MNREAIYAAAFAKFSNSSDFITKSRYLQHWSEVQPEAHPAIFQTQIGEENFQERGLPAKWKLRLSIYIYVHTAAQQLDPNVVPSQLLNPLLDAFEACLAVDNQQVGACTLNGLVSRIWIDGNIETSEGILGDQEVAIIPVSIVVPS